MTTDSSGAMKAYVDDYNKQHPDSKVNLREIPFAGYDAALNQAFSTKTGPDLMGINSSTFPTFAERGDLKALDSVIKTEGQLAESNFYPSLWKTGQWDGELLGLPVDTGTRVLQWNKVLFDQAGIKPFGETVKWEDMISAAQKIDELSPDTQGYCYATGQNWLAMNEGVGPMVHQAGGSFFNEGLTEATVTTPEVVKAFEAYKQLAATGDKSNTVAQSMDACTEQFGAGKVGMQMGGFWSLPTEKTTTGPLELHQSLPMDKTTFSSTGGWILGVPAYVSDEKSEAINAFLQDAYKPENIVKFTGLFPATKDGRGAATKLKDSKYDIYWKILEENAAYPIPLNPKISEQATILMETLQQVIQGGQSTEEILKQAEPKFNATLKK